ncbi:macro domain-containing protein [Nitrosovibrio sp. Nv6]|uniref:macro domain-containing protein n=1 Tax=Nitrosovibrio sp. Nv6 TaxID=1855340 RepID=UPI0008B89D37|nr:macro domain-containing protein [Nitrosovibrio sp. Nv6]SEP18693.1 O-acetyl-ADP-ribose deacetylase (regulator of RNase III), contains Macro domain [Nitrosovibrio sp. Nv6]
MIHEVRGDILLSHAQVIVHAVAPHDHFDQGLALSLRQQWPALVKDFRHFCHTGQPKSGEAWVWSGAMSKRVVSLLTNEAPKNSESRPGRARTEYVDRALRELRHLLESGRFANVALPRIATGAGGLDWQVVEPLIKHHLGELELPVYVYTHYEKGRQANEPGLSIRGGTQKK